ncbi:hypothetical protein C1H46_026142 [Malus baccata]|uniref:Uncharacterized protein n=1 Tax=Malus baccata TaxID=106549 RepID=A0A540LP39_MALBA|nr:hypothetical protein C1H46_026142 [Malus baccata]
MASLFVLNLGIAPLFSEGVDGAPSMGLLSFPALAVAPFPSMERWSNPPSTGSVDGVLSSGHLPMDHGILIWSFWAIWGSVLKILQNIKSNSKFGGSHLTTCLLLLSCFSPVKDNYMLSPLQRCPLCVWYRLRARNVVFGIAVVSLDLKIWHFFPNIVTTMGSSCAPCDNVFMDSAAYVVGEDLFRIFRLFCVATFRPLRLDLGFWNSMYFFFFCFWYR